MSHAPAIAATTPLSPREQRRLEHAELSRNQLLDAAETVFGEQGFHETTLKQIAELAGFSVGSVYSFFDSKDDLFAQLFVRRGQEFMAGMRAAVDSEGTPLDQLHALIDFQVGFFRSHPRFGRLYLRYSNPVHLSPDRPVDRTVAPEYHESMRLQADLIARGQADGLFRGGDPDDLARLFSGMVSAFHAIDPAVLGQDRPEGVPLADLHRMIEAAFRAG